MKTKEFFRPIFREAWLLTTNHKAWWIFGFLALFLLSSLGYQSILSGLRILTSPDALLETWQRWVIFSEPARLLQGQFETFRSNPQNIIELSLYMLGIVVGVLALFFLTVFGLTVILSGAKQYLKTQRLLVDEAVREAFYHFKPVFWATVLAGILTNALIIVFSLPVILLASEQGSASNLILMGLLFALFVAAAFFIGVMSVFTVVGIVLDDYSLSQSIQAAWGILKRHLVVTIELVLLHAMIALVLGFILVVFVSLLVIPVAIVGPIFVAANKIAIVENMPVVILTLLYLGFAIVGSIFSFFQLLTWAFFYNRIDDIKPYSRIASFAELQLRIDQ